jgi:hypothetical protein
MTNPEELQPGMTVRVLEARPVAEGIVTWINGEDVAVQGANGQEIVFGPEGDNDSISEYLVTVVAPPGPVPPEPPLGTHWLGDDGLVYTHFHSSYRTKPWVGNGMWDLTWPEVYWRARPLAQIVVPDQTVRID